MFSFVHLPKSVKAGIIWMAMVGMDVQLYNIEPEHN
jgi:hypothetical protein